MLATDGMIGKAAEAGLFRVIDNLESPAHSVQQGENADLRRPAIAVRVSAWAGGSSGGSTCSSSRFGGICVSRAYQVRK